MSNSILIDNDVLLKLSYYNVAERLTECLKEGGHSIHILGFARFVLQKAVSKTRKVTNKKAASECLERLLSSVSEIEPSDDELALAAALEAVAQVNDLELDVGESQLLSVLIMRSADFLLTGDKRAIRAIEEIMAGSGYRDNVSRKVACLEQVIASFVRRYGVDDIHSCVCQEPRVDTTLTICLRCDSQNYTSKSVLESLRSYTTHLRRDAAIVLTESDDLSALISYPGSIG